MQRIVTFRRSLSNAVKANAYWSKVNYKQHENGECSIRYDDKIMNTDEGIPIVLPTKALAIMMLNEWEGKTSKTSFDMPISCIINTALFLKHNPDAKIGVIGSILPFLSADCISYLNDSNEVLRKRQSGALDWVNEHLFRKHNLIIQPNLTIIPPKPSSDCMTKFKAALESLNEWQLASFDTAARSLKSLSLGLCLVEQAISSKDAVKFSKIEVDYQIENWGVIPDAHELDFINLEKIVSAAAFVASASK